MTHVIAQEAIEASKSTILAVGEEDNEVNNARPAYAMSRLSGSLL